ncbi:DUF547 domain-containing protein/Lzipper-MIP1 domain-containing protein [Cephalotus follicularis]|uniref:DUF547 domain-containing protein/Lzipper-MIP1 domain-containing protein n=1 Tax=Cephalotus follicularis TaxID=3775 RepID=A0A1Q3DCU7_CEPFO|nr:DUF547 domain-containing protein/Lzipper-MIP1 domain-containing protein [Cephalotus follicularis]
MKFEDLLMQPNEENQKRQLLEQEVENLQAELDKEQALNKILQCALHRPVSSQLCLTSLLPPQVQALLAELALAEKEILWLERKVQMLKIGLYHEKKQTKGWQMQHSQLPRVRKVQQQNHLQCGLDSRSILSDDIYHRSRSQNYDEFDRDKLRSYRRSSVGSAGEALSMSSTGSIEEIHERSRRVAPSRILNQYQINKEKGNEKPNKLSEELVKCLVGIFLELNQASHYREGSANVPKLSLTCMNPKGFMSKASFNCKAPLFLFNHSTPNPDPYGILQETEGGIRDIGPYRNFIQITSSSIDISRFVECSQQIRKLRVLMHKLCNVDLMFLTYKQKLAFWINIYNACIMHAFLEHGLPSTQEKLLALMNKAALNVGGIVLNALAIEHFILRHPCEAIHGPTHEKEMLLRQAYGLGYPEPNVTFALCRGTRSSPALRVYTPDEVVNELGRAKVEYLEASVGVTSKRKIVVPKLLQWHMHDFADDIESLLEWIYSQLPRSGSLKRLIMECLNEETKSPTADLVEIQPYESEFRYLMPL